MNKFLILFIATLFSLSSCTVMKDVRRATYTVSLDRVDVPSDSKEGVSGTVEKTDINKYLFENEYFKITWFIGSTSLFFEIYNKTNHSLKINWDDIIYVNTKREISKMVHSDISKLKDLQQFQVPITIPKGANYSDFLTPVTNLSCEDNVYFAHPLLPQHFSTDEELEIAKGLEGDSISVLFPIIFDNTQNDYTFNFKINSVEVEKKQEHDRKAENNRTTAALGLGALAGMSVFFLLVLKIIP